MKQQYLEIRKSIVGLMVAGMILIFSAPASAKSTKEITPTKYTLVPQIKFIGNQSGSALYTVSLNSEALLKFEITITQANGTMLYRQLFEATEFSKTFKLASEDEFLSNDLIFSIKNLSDGVTQNFQVKTSTELVNSVVIKKNK